MSTKALAEPGLPCSLKARFSRAMDGTESQFYRYRFKFSHCFIQNEFENHPLNMSSPSLILISINEEFDVIVLL